MKKNYAVFLRHGDYQHRKLTPGAYQPYPLTEEGRAQSERCVEKLQKFCTEHKLRIAPVLHTSCLLRAWQTADLIRQKLAAETNLSYSLQETEQLCERSVGSLANLSISEIEQVLHDDPRYEVPPPGWKSDSHYKLPYPFAESLMQAGKRAATYIDSVMAAWPDDAGIMQLFIGHGASFRHASCHKGMLEFEQLAQLSMYHAEPICFTLDREKQWLHQAGAWKIRSHISSYTD